MCNNDNKQNGLKCDVVVYDEMIRYEDVTTMKIKEQLKQEQQNDFESGRRYC
ncbi:MULTISPECIES: hypothetical protein [Bacillus cereus group]|uniref:hypothetical protein n=1 Tax=Bacillus cereus group TaxID=86661 RepID=UPI00040C66FB|nr:MULTISPECIES: hypothetical protein [Bacillus cereus group]QUG97242.1 hypothetical protein HCM98_20820 [Bacillus tropicus]